MALVEGIGDEVTALAALVAALGLLGLAWFSTRTGERGEAALPEGSPTRREAPPRPDRRQEAEEEEEEEDGGEEEEEEEEGPAGSPFVLRLKFLNETERLARVRPRDTVGGLK
ncbi:transmembrane and ubiquitin-like domain-containing protein 1, partial [Pseudonaja textilis]|uniref:transmembrane and ubiquitin-like domain-containing protein 1 n=1 Tax=Pseudonaja textilis TaxID=8673 RepID=UPI000EA8DA21